MNKFQKRLTTFGATVVVLANSALPAFAATTTLIISGNGTDTESNVEVNKATSTYVTQTNVTEVKNEIKTNANTGSNDVRDTTGGGVKISSGNSKVDVTVENQLNSNVAQVEACGSCDGDVFAKIAGNGAGAESEVKLNLNTGKDAGTIVQQSNVANVENEVDVKSNTGANSAEDTTGGDVKVYSGDSTVTMTAKTVANSNAASISGDSNGGGDVEVGIIGNGTDTENEVELDLNSVRWITQDNLTQIKNELEADSNTGENLVDDATGGLNGISSGNSSITAEVDNQAGFNMADLSCCAIGDVLATVTGNGEDAESEIEASLDNTQGVEQANLCGGSQVSLFGGPMRRDDPCFDNELDLNGFTGDNMISDSTGTPSGDDPLIYSGDDTQTVTVKNAGGFNTFGNFEMPEWPTSGTGLDFSISFDLSDLFAWFQAQQA